MKAFYCSFLLPLRWQSFLRASNDQTRPNDHCTMPHPAGCYINRNEIRACVSRDSNREIVESQKKQAVTISLARQRSEQIRACYRARCRLSPDTSAFSGTLCSAEEIRAIVVIATQGESKFRARLSRIMDSRERRAASTALERLYR